MESSNYSDGFWIKLSLFAGALAGLIILFMYGIPEPFKTPYIPRATSQDIELMAEYTPIIYGVPIVNKTKMVMDSGVLSGIIPYSNNLIGQTLDMKGEKAYGIGNNIIANTLELDTTQNLLRHHLNSAMTSYIPADGIDAEGLWYQRTTLDKLNQPGLHPIEYSYSWYSGYGF